MAPAFPATVHPTDTGLEVTCQTPGPFEFFRSVNGGPWTALGARGCAFEDSGFPVGAYVRYAARTRDGIGPSELSNSVGVVFAGPPALELIGSAQPHRGIALDLEAAPVLGQSFLVPRAGAIRAAQLGIWLRLAETEAPPTCFLTTDDGRVLATGPASPAGDDASSASLGTQQDTGVLCDFSAAPVALSAGAPVAVFVAASSPWNFRADDAAGQLPGGSLLEGRGEHPQRALQLRVWLDDPPAAGATVAAEAVPGYGAVSIRWAPVPQALAYEVLAGADCASTASAGSTAGLSFDVTGLGRAQPGCYGVVAHTPLGPINSTPLSATTLDLDVASFFGGVAATASMTTQMAVLTFTAEKTGTLAGVELTQGGSGACIRVVPAGSWRPVECAIASKVPFFCCLDGELQPELPSAVTADLSVFQQPIVAGQAYDAWIYGQPFVSFPVSTGDLAPGASIALDLLHPTPGLDIPFRVVIR
jgi:hypothetical protein